MQKLFRFIAVIFSLYGSPAVIAADSLCPAPVKTAPIAAENQPHPSADEYHAAMQSAVLTAETTLDWVIDPTVDGNCGGYYRAPDNPNPERNKKPDEAELRMSADVVEKGQDGFTNLSGDVELYQGMRRLRCDLMRYSEEKEYSEVTGSIQLREPGLLLLSEEAIFDNLNRNSSFKQTEYVLHDQQAHGKAGTIAINAQNDQGYLTLQDASFTICPPTAEYWSFEAKRIELDHQEGWGKMYSAWFEVVDVPVLYIPYIDFPIDDRRKSGFLWPSISSGENGGIDFAVPYYFNLAPQADLTYIPHYQSGHGTLHGIETRYKHKYSEWALGGTYLDNDKRIGDVSIKDDPTLDRQRWMGFIQEEGRFNANWSTTIDFQAVSDINYFRDWGTTGFDVQKSLNIRRYATINFANDDWKASSTVMDYETLEVDPLTNDLLIEDYRQLPTIDVFYRNRQNNFFFSPVFFGQYTFFDHEQRIRAHRLHLEPGFVLPMRWQAGEIISTFRIKHNEFNFNESNDATDVTQSGTVFQGDYGVDVPSININSRLFFERELAIGSGNFLQTLTPRLFFYYADYVDQSHLPSFDTAETSFSYPQLFRDSRFGSYDRIGDASQISLALESDLISKSDGNKLFSVGIGQIHYQRDREVTVYNTDNQLQVISPLDSADTIKEKEIINAEINRRYFRQRSDIVVEPNWYIDDKQRISGSIIWDPYLSQNQETAIGYHYKDNRKRIFNIAYRYKRNPLYNNNGTWFTLNNVDQTDLSFYLPVAQNWHAYMRWNYDITNNKTIEDITGVKYEGCCFGVMLAYQRERNTFANNTRIADTAPVSYDYSWFIQFELKGLGGITNTITHLLEESIQGFYQRERDL
jgi:LPS-assembly protein